MAGTFAPIPGPGAVQSQNWKRHRCPSCKVQICLCRWTSPPHQGNTSLDAEGWSICTLLEHKRRPRLIWAYVVAICLTFLSKIIQIRYLECICGAFSQLSRSICISPDKITKEMKLDSAITWDGEEVQRAMLVGDKASSAICAQPLFAVCVSQSKTLRVCFSPVSMVTRCSQVLESGRNCGETRGSPRKGMALLTLRTFLDSICMAALASVSGEASSISAAAFSKITSSE